MTAKPLAGQRESLQPTLEDDVSDLECPPGTWRKSTASGTSNCVEVSFAGSSVLMRQSQSPQGPVLSFSHPEWEAFVTGVRGGEFDTTGPDHSKRQRE
jgi:hypothetical protein